MKPFLQWQGGQYLKILISASGNCFLQFSQALVWMESVFWSSEIAFFNAFFVLADENGFPIIYKPCVFTYSFFLLVDTILEISANQFSTIFSTLNSGSSFSGYCKRIFYQMLNSGEWKQIFCLVLFYSEQILCCWEPLIKLRWSHFL